MTENNNLERQSKCLTRFILFKTLQRLYLKLEYENSGEVALPVPACINSSQKTELRRHLLMTKSGSDSCSVKLRHNGYDVVVAMATRTVCQHYLC